MYASRVPSLVVVAVCYGGVVVALKINQYNIYKNIVRKKIIPGARGASASRALAFEQAVGGVNGW